MVPTADEDRAVLVLAVEVGVRQIALCSSTTPGEWLKPSNKPWYSSTSDIFGLLMKQTVSPSERHRLETLLTHCWEQVHRDVNLPGLLGREDGIQFIDELEFEQTMEAAQKSMIKNWAGGRGVFTRKFPLGVTRISSPCYSQDRRMALVYREEHNAPLNGIAHVILLKKIGLTWSIIKKLKIWRS